MKILSRNSLKLNNLKVDNMYLTVHCYLMITAFVKAIWGYLIGSQSLVNRQYPVIYFIWTGDEFVIL